MTTPMTDNARRDEGKLIELALAAKLPNGATLETYLSFNSADAVELGALKEGEALSKLDISRGIQLRHCAEIVVRAMLPALARRSIQEQPEAEDDGWSELHDRPEIPARNPRVVKVLNASAPPPIAGAGWKQSVEELISDLSRWDRLQFGGTKQHQDGAKQVKKVITDRLKAILASPAPDNTDARGAQVKDAERLAQLEQAMTKIDGIRNSIIGLQTMNWSEHIYPLVAALQEAGFEGLGYPASRENFGTMLERTNAAEAERDTLAARLSAIIPGTDASAVIEQANALAAAARNDALDAAADTCHDVGASDAERLIRSMRGTIAPPASAYELDPVKAPKP